MFGNLLFYFLGYALKSLYVHITTVTPSKVENTKLQQENTASAIDAFTWKKG